MGGEDKQRLLLCLSPFLALSPSTSSFTSLRTLCLRPCPSSSLARPVRPKRKDKVGDKVTDEVARVKIRLLVLSANTPRPKPSHTDDEPSGRRPKRRADADGPHIG